MNSCYFKVERVRSFPLVNCKFNTTGSFGCFRAYWAETNQSIQKPAMGRPSQHYGKWKPTKTFLGLKPSHQKNHFMILGDLFFCLGHQVHVTIFRFAPFTETPSPGPTRHPLHLHKKNNQMLWTRLNGRKNDHQTHRFGGFHVGCFQKMCRLSWKLELEDETWIGFRVSPLPSLYGFSFPQ